MRKLKTRRKYPDFSHPNRLRNKAWHDLANTILDANPYCINCQKNGLTELATEVDHIIPLFKGGSNDLDNLQGLCRDCHLDKTRKEKRTRGCDIHGNPFFLLSQQERNP